jgi:hypothetical protein
MFAHIFNQPQTPKVVIQAGLRSVVSTANNLVITQIQAYLRQTAQGEIDAAIPTIDLFNDAKAVEDVQETADENREEQGYAPRTHPMAVAARLKFVRDCFADMVNQQAGLVELSNGKKVPNPYEVAQTIEETLTWKLTQDAKPNMAVLTAEAKEAGVPVSILIEAANQSNASRRRFLERDKTEIKAHLASLALHDEDGFEYTPDDIEKVLDLLPVMIQLQLAAAALRGMTKGIAREFTRKKGDAQGFLSNFGILKANVIDLERIVRDFMVTKAVEIRDALDQGATMPNFPDSLETKPELPPAPEKVVKPAAKPRIIRNGVVIN